MTFGAIGFLFAALAAAIPVVLHMIHHQRAKEVPFSTLRFLKISVEKTRRRRRIQDLLLMLLRMALFVLIAVGLAKPALTSLGTLLGGGSQSAVALIVDNSASMGVVDSGEMRFDTAVKAALQVTDELEAGDAVALYVTGGPRFPEEGKLDRSQEKVRQILNQLLNERAVSYERADLAARLDDARSLLAKSDAPNKQIFVLSDQQQRCWEGLKEETADENLRDAELEKRKIPVIVVDCGRQPEANVAVVDVDVQAAVPVTGVPIQATVELFNPSTVAQPQRVELYLDNAKESTSPELTLTPGGRVKHTFEFELTTAGIHRGEVRLARPDGSALDDRRFFTVTVDQGIPVAIVKARRHEIRYLDDSFYVEQALAPARSGGWAIRTMALTPDDLMTERLSTYAVVYCVNLPAPGPELAQRLRAYVEGGGNLVWICGDNVEPDAYNQMNQQAEGSLLPAPLLDVRSPQPGEGRDSWSIAFLDKEHRALRDFAEPPSLYQSVLVYKHVRMDARAAEGAAILARLDDGEAILAERSAGKGRVTMLGTSAHVGWTNLPLRPLFLPLCVRLTFVLAGAEQVHHQALAGAPITITFDDETRPLGIEVLPPSGATVRLKLVDDEGNRADSFRFADTHDVGIYTFRLLEAIRPTQYAYSVNFDPDEADLTKISREELARRLSQTPLVFADNPEDLSSTFDYLREGTSLWEVFLSAVLIALVFETFVSNRFSPRQNDGDLKHAVPDARRGARVARAVPV